MKDFQLVRYCADEATVLGTARFWLIGWLDILRGVIRVASFGTLDTDAKLWFLLNTKAKKPR